MDKLVISVVSYLNAIPFRYALQNAAAKYNWEIQTDIPSVCADKLISGKADIGLIPVAEIERVPNARIIGNYCIAAHGDVKSVLLLSEVPLSEIKTIMLDYQSRTSVRLCRLLADSYWNITPLWENTYEGYESMIKGKKAGLVIGDRAIDLKSKYKYVYDLSGEWKKYSGGRPFMFACWVSSRRMDAHDILLFNEVLKKGVGDRLEILDREKIMEIEKRDYILNTIQYDKTTELEHSLQIFLELSKKFH